MRRLSTSTPAAAQRAPCHLLAAPTAHRRCHPAALVQLTANSSRRAASSTAWRRRAHLLSLKAPACRADALVPTHPQIEALRCELDRMAEADPSAKAIVFSQFTSFLDLIHFRLEQVGGGKWTLRGAATAAIGQRTASAACEWRGLPPRHA